MDNIVRFNDDAAIFRKASELGKSLEELEKKALNASGEKKKTLEFRIRQIKRGIRRIPEKLEF